MRRFIFALLPVAVFAACSDYAEDVPSADVGAPDSGGDTTLIIGSGNDASPDASIDAADAEAGAGLAVELIVDDVSLSEDGSVKVIVTVTRPAGEDAVIDVTIEGLPAELKTQPAKVSVGVGQTTATFTLSRSFGAPVGDITVTAHAAGGASAGDKAFKVHLLSGGVPDKSFGVDGVLSLPSAGLNTLGPDGSLYLVTCGSEACEVEKRMPTGALDNAWGVNGVAATAKKAVPSLVPFQVALAPAGGLLIVGQESEGAFDVIHFSAAGVFDATFATTGYIQIPRAADESYFSRAIAVGPAGQILISYLLHHVDDTNEFRLAQYLANGKPDPAWTEPKPKVNDSFGIDFLPSGDALVIGSTPTELGVFTINGTTGALVQGPKFFDWGHPLQVAYRTAPIATGGAFLVGWVSDSGSFKGSAIAAAKYGDTLNLVTAFGTGGVASKRLGSDANKAEALVGAAIDGHGRLVAAGISDHNIVVARFTSAGFDPSFGIGGVKTLSSGGNNPYDVAVAVVPSGDIIVSAHVPDPDNSTALFHLHP